MPSIDSPAIIHEMLLNNGTYPGDPQMFAILTYTNDRGGSTYKICLSAMAFVEAITSSYVHNPVVLWTRVGGRSVVEGL